MDSRIFSPIHSRLEHLQCIKLKHFMPSNSIIIPLSKISKIKWVARSSSPSEAPNGVSWAQNQADLRWTGFGLNSACELITPAHAQLDYPVNRAWTQTQLSLPEPTGLSSSTSLSCGCALIWVIKLIPGSWLQNEIRSLQPPSYKDNMPKKKKHHHHFVERCGSMEMLGEIFVKISSIFYIPKKYIFTCLLPKKNFMVHHRIWLRIIDAWREWNRP